MSGATQILLDCDPGHDDALALTLALARPELELVGITTVGGNVAVERVTDNCLRVLALLDRPDVPVAVGAGEPLAGRAHRRAEHVHGETGLDGAPLPDPASAPVDAPALDFAAETIERHPGLTLVATGPLTNVATLLRERPQLRDGIAAIALMGGSAGHGNITPSAEFNAYCDPEAAQVVFDSGLPITMMGLDVTHRALIRTGEIEALRASGGRVSAVFGDLLAFFLDAYERRHGWGGCPVHDAVPVAELACPGIVRLERHRVDVELDGRLTRGRTVVDLDGVTGAPANADVGLDIDRDRFAELLLDAVRGFD